MYTIHVTNIHEAVRAPELQQLFSEYGGVRRVVVVEGVKPRFALVHMTREYEACAAVIATHGRPIQGRLLQVVAYFEDTALPGERSGKPKPQNTTARVRT